MAATNIHYAAAVLDITVRGGLLLRVGGTFLESGLVGYAAIEERSFVAKDAPLDDAQRRVVLGERFVSSANDFDSAVVATEAVEAGPRASLARDNSEKLKQNLKGKI